LTNESKSNEYYKNLILSNKFDKNLLDLVKAIKKRIDIKWDCVFVVDGEEGVGKSSLSILLGYLLDKDFDLDKNIAYLPQTSEVEEKFRSIESKQVLLIDEAIKAFYKLRFMDKMQARINIMYATERKQRKITILCIPRFTDLNEFFRNDRVQFWIHLIDRGHAIAFVKDKINIFKPDRWHMKEEEKRIGMLTYKKKFSEIGTEDCIRVYEKSQLFWFAFSFPELPSEVESRYLELRENYTGNSTEKEEMSKRDRVNKILDIVTTPGGKKLFSIKEIAEMANCTTVTVDKEIRKRKESKPITL
jgi:hypothetical protein